MLLSFDCAPYETEEKRGRVGLFECECGCGQSFFSLVITRHPRYANKTHRARAYRARARARAYADAACSQNNTWEEDVWNMFFSSEYENMLYANRGR